MFFADENNGWAVGWAGAMIRTTDGGQTWTKLRAGVMSLKSVIFDDKGTGWIAAETHLLSSDDGGATWRSVGVPGALSLASVLPTREAVLAVGQSGVFRHIPDTMPTRSGS